MRRNVKSASLRYATLEVISKEGVSPDPEKAKAIQELPAPQNVSELRQVLGMINYLGKFLPKPVS